MKADLGASGSAAAVDRKGEGESENDSPAEDGHGAKDELMAIAEFERAGMQLAPQEVYINMTGLFGQIYVQRDLSSI